MKQFDDVPIIYWLMFTLFVGLKLTGQIDWEWYWIVSPFGVYFLLTVLWGLAVPAYEATIITLSRRFKGR